MTNEEMQKLLDKLFDGDVSVYNSAIEITHPRLDAWDVIRMLLSDHAEKLAADMDGLSKAGRYWMNDALRLRERNKELEVGYIRVQDKRNALVNACVAAYIEDTGLACAQQLKDAVIAATGKTPEQIYGIDEVTR